MAVPPENGMTHCVGHRNGHRFPGTGRDGTGRAGMWISTLVYRKGRAGTTRDRRGRVQHGSGPQGRGFDSLQAHHYSQFGSRPQRPLAEPPVRPGSQRGHGFRRRLTRRPSPLFASLRPSAALMSRDRTTPGWSAPSHAPDVQTRTSRLCRRWSRLAWSRSVAAAMYFCRRPRSASRLLWSIGGSVDGLTGTTCSLSPQPSSTGDGT
jgi:hypothetical protein